MTTKTTPLSNFVGTMLAEARVSRGLTQTQLAELSGISKQSISNYEKDKQSPRLLTIEKLASALNVLPTFFHTQPIADENSPVYFRSLAKLTKREREKAKVKLNWLARVVECYDKYLELPSVNIPQDLDISCRLKSVSDEEIEDIALRCRKAFGIGDGPISNVTMLMENNGVIILRMPLDVKEEDAFSRWALQSSTPVAVLAASKPSACRERFSLAHELGHLVMHRGITPSKENLKLIELQANRFASAFLLPAHSYVRDFGYPSLDVLKLLKSKWKVSIQMQVIRCWQLGVISDASKRNFFINISKRKWRTKEPLDDTIPFEQPKVLKESTKLLCKDGGLTFEDISHETSLSLDDLSRLTGVPYKEEPQAHRQRPKLKAKKTEKKIINFPSPK